MTNAQKDLLLTKDDKNELMSKSEGDKMELISKIGSIKTDLIKLFAASLVTLALMIVGLYLKKLGDLQRPIIEAAWSPRRFFRNFI